MKTSSHRIEWIDQWRGLAALLMVIYHFAFDLNYLSLAQVDLSTPTWLIMGNFIRISFLLLVGISIYLSSKRHKKLVRYQLRRAVILFLIAMGITGITWFFALNTIHFGILHLISVSIVIGSFFAKKPKVSLALAALVLVGGAIIGEVRLGHNLLLPLGFYTSNYTSLDYFPIFPWAGFALLGISLGHLFEYFGTFKKELGIRIGWLQFLGRHALTTYLIHQPIILAGIWLFAKMN